MEVRPSYDVILIGAGISGLFAAREILKKHPTWSVAIAEKYKALGGRTSTYHKDGVQWEAGAGRISVNHTHVLKLIKEYGLTFFPISEEIAFAERDGTLVSNPFEALYVPFYIAPLAKLSPTVLATHTIQELLENIYGKEKTRTILETFPYRAEVTTLRADLALQTFLHGDMKSHKGYGVLAEGFSALVDALVRDIESRGGVFLRRHTLLNLAHVSGNPTATDCIFQFGRGSHGEPHGQIRLRAERACFLTLCRCHVAALPFLRNVPALRYVIGKPLFRIYMIFKPIQGRMWFEGLSRVVTPMRPRYILPIDVKKGVIMISYTDSDDTREYATILKTKGESALEAVVLADVRRVFPDRKIPRPIFTKAHLWDTGASYWIPGTYDPVEESRRAMRPLAEFKGLYMCGESWSLRQAWVEGALEHTAACLKESGLV